MRLIELRVDGFGILNGLHLSREELAKNITVIHGLNEAGKSTLLEFIRAVLFGFKTRDGRGAGPLRGGRLGGHLVFMDKDGGIYRVERILRGRQGKAAVVLPDGSTGDETILKNKVLHNITPLVFRSVFAFGVDEMRRLEELGEGEVGAYVYGAGAGVRADRLAGGLNRLQEEMSGLFKPGGSKPEINRLLRELEDLEADIRNLQREPEHYKELRRELAGLKEKREDLARQRKQAELRRNWLEKLLKARESWVRLADARLQLEELPPAPSLPEDSEEILQALDVLDAGVKRLSLLKERLEQQAGRLQELKRQEDDITGELKMLRTPFSPLWLPAALAVALAVFITASFSTGLVPGLLSLAAGAAVLALVTAAVRRGAAGLKSRRSRLGENLNVLKRKIEEAEKEVEHLSGQAASLGEELKRTAVTALGKPDFTEEVIAAARRVLEEDLRRRAERRLKGERLKEKVRACERELNIIAGSPRARAILEKDLAEREDGDIERELDHLTYQIERMDKEIMETGERVGELEGRLRSMEKGEELAARLQEKEMKLAALRSRAGEWQVRALCLRLLHLAKERHERSRQPAVLRQASRYLGPMTGGRYAGVIAPVGRTDMLEVETPDGARVAAGSLSRGAASQLYLAVRLALARQYDGAGLPVILDDILVDFDPERLKGAARVLGEFGRDRQVILFTCHDHVLAALGECLDDYGLVRLQDGVKVNV